MINSSVPQGQRELQAFKACNSQVDFNVEAHSNGEFDAIIGADPDPQLILNKDYWAGYQSKQFEYYCRKYGIQLTKQT